VKEDSVPLYSNTVAVRRDGVEIGFRSPVCRPKFDRDRWNATLNRRQAAVDRLVHYPGEAYDEFAELVLELEERRRVAFPHQEATVKLKDFLWLRCTSSGIRAAPVAPSEQLMCGPGLYYPYHCDAEECGTRGTRGRSCRMIWSTSLIGRIRTCRGRQVHALEHCNHSPEISCYYRLVIRDSLPQPNCIRFILFFSTRCRVDLHSLAAGWRQKLVQKLHLSRRQMPRPHPTGVRPRCEP
jgi:hypothetical protein